MKAWRCSAAGSSRLFGGGREQAIGADILRLAFPKAVGAQEPFLLESKPQEEGVAGVVVGGVLGNEFDEAKGVETERGNGKQRLAHQTLA